MERSAALHPTAVGDGPVVAGTTTTEDDDGDPVGLVDVVAHDAFPRGWPGVRSVAHVERCTVERTGDGVSTKATFAQWRVGMRAVVVERVELAVDAADHDAVAADVLEAAQLPIGQIAEVAQFDRGSTRSSVASDIERTHRQVPVDVVVEEPDPTLLPWHVLAAEPA